MYLVRHHPRLAGFILAHILVAEKARRARVLKRDTHCSFVSEPITPSATTQDESSSLRLVEMETVGGMDEDDHVEMTATTSPNQVLSFSPWVNQVCHLP